MLHPDVVVSRDPRRYVVSRSQYNCLPRWENDGIERFKERVATGTQRTFDVESNHPFQDAMVVLLNGWFLSLPYADDQPWSISAVEYAWHLQFYEAQKCADFEKATLYLDSQYQLAETSVMSLLEESGAKDMFRVASANQCDYPDVARIIWPLLKKDLASEENMQKMFGSVDYVRSELLRLGAFLSNPPPVDSPDAVVLYDMMEITAQTPTCGFCTVSAKDTHLLRCSLCKTTHYCSTRCQKLDRKRHKVLCYTLSNKIPTERDFWGMIVAEKGRKQDAEYEAEVFGSVADNLSSHVWNGFMKWMKETAVFRRVSWLEYSPAYLSQFLFNAEGVEKHITIPTPYAEYYLSLFPQNSSREMNAQLRVCENICFATKPRGFEVSSDLGKHAQIFQRCDNRALVVVLYDRLFVEENDPITEDSDGICVEGIYVIDHVVTDGSQRVAVWRNYLLDEKHAHHSMNRHYLLHRNLIYAKCKATVEVGDDVTTGLEEEALTTDVLHHKQNLQLVQSCMSSFPALKRARHPYTCVLCPRLHKILTPHGNA